MCIKWHVWFNIHVLSMRLPPPSPTKHCWYTHASYSFPVHYLWQHWFWGAGNGDFITQCPNSFVQDCIQRLKKFSTKIRKCLIKSKRAVGIAWFLQGTTFRLSILTYTKYNGKPYCLDIKLDLYWCRLMNFKQKTIFSSKMSMLFGQKWRYRRIKK